MRDPYAVLGVTQQAPDYVIQAAYRACLKKFHPDHYNGADASAKTAEIVEAFELLRDPVRRRAYDESRGRSSAGARQPPPPQPPYTRQPDEGRQANRSKPLWAAGALAAAAVTYLLWLGSQPAGLAQGGAYDPAETAANAEAMSYDNNPGSGLDSALRSPTLPPSMADTPEPVDYDNIESAAKKFASILQRSGISGARKYSEDCHRSQREAPSWKGLDYCAAFDFAAEGLDRAFTTSMRASSNGYFQFQAANQTDYYPQTVAFFRLQTIQKASQAALEDFIIDDTPAARTASPPQLAPAPTSSASAVPEPAQKAPQSPPREWNYYVDSDGNLTTTQPVG